MWHLSVVSIEIRVRVGRNVLMDFSLLVSLSHTQFPCIWEGRIPNVSDHGFAVAGEMIRTLLQFVNKIVLQFLAIIRQAQFLACADTERYDLYTRQPDYNMRRTHNRCVCVWCTSTSFYSCIYAVCGCVAVDERRCCCCYARTEAVVSARTPARSPPKPQYTTLAFYSKWIKYKIKRSESRAHEIDDAVRWTPRQNYYIFHS